MANHVNRQIREAIQSRLTGLASTGSRVYPYRLNNLDYIDDLPALCVHTPSDTASVITIHNPPVYSRVIEVAIYAYASALANLDDDLDTVRAEVEAALGSQLTIGAQRFQPIYTGSSVELLEGARPAGQLELNYQVTVYHAGDTPDQFS